MLTRYKIKQKLVRERRTKTRECMVKLVKRICKKLGISHRNIYV